MRPPTSRIHGPIGAGPAAEAMSGEPTIVSPSALAGGLEDGAVMSGAPRRLPCRRHRLPRCRVCGLHRSICVCPLLPRVDVPCRLLLVQHAVEIDRPTNTGRLAAHMWPNSRILPYGLRGVPFDEAPLLDPSLHYRLLHPAPGALVLSEEEIASAGPPDRTVFVILDGSWRQAAHMARRIPALRAMPGYRLPDGPAGRWQIRRPRKAHELCTVEAVVRIVGLLGRGEEARRMEEAMDLVHARMLYMKGRLPCLPQPGAAASERKDS